MIKNCNFKHIVSQLTGANNYLDAIDLFNYWYENNILDMDKKLESDFLGTLAGWWNINVPILIYINDDFNNEILIKFGCTKYNPNKELGHLKLQVSKWYVENIL